MKLLVTGGTGFIGAPLCQALAHQGHEMLVVTRDPSRHRAQPSIHYLSWASNDWQHRLANVQGIVNLAGEPLVAKRWTPQQKAAIQASRIQTTRRLVEVLRESQPRPRVLINASAIGYYGPRGDEVLNETASPGHGFLPEVCRAWEAEAQQAQGMGVRVACFRLGIVLGPDGGALAKMVPPFRCWIGGPLGSGRQWMSWIHRDDVIGLIAWALTRDDVAGPMNATAPAPARMAEFCRTLGRVVRRPSWAPVPAPILRLLLGEMAEMLLTGQRVLPEAAVRFGYAFRFPDLEGALRDCLT